MKLFIAFALSALSSAGFANGYIECTGKSQALEKDVKVFVDFENGRATVEVLGEEGFKSKIKVTSVYDGHMTGLVTGPGFALKYEDQYGCLRNASITTSVRNGAIGFIDTINVPLCSGGTTSEDICRG